MILRFLTRVWRFVSPTAAAAPNSWAWWGLPQNWSFWTRRETGRRGR